MTDITNEFIAFESELNSRFGGKKWLKNDGFKKLILYEKLSDFLRQNLPNNFNISKAYVLCKNELIKADIIVYEGIELYKNAEFVVVLASQVRAIVQILGTFKPKNFYSLISSLTAKKAKISNEIFAGICAYDYEKETQNANFSQLFMPFRAGFEQKLQSDFAKNGRFVDVASFGKDYFMHFWRSAKPQPHYPNTRYYFYHMPHRDQGAYSFEYLVGNLKNHLALNGEKHFTIPDGKDEHTQWECQITLARDEI